MDNMLEEIPSSLFMEWMAYYNLEPFGTMQGYYQAGIISSTFVNANPFRGKDSKSVSPTDFIPDFTKELEDEKTIKEKRIEKLSLILTGMVTGTEEERKALRKKRVQETKRKKKVVKK